MKNIAIFASGSGSNAENIITYFLNSKTEKISLVLTNNSDAFVLQRAKKFDIPAVVFSKKEMNTSTAVSDLLQRYNVDYIVLAGFLLLIPKTLTETFAGRIINIHPALLPKFGGKGMYGDKVHEAVKESGDTQTGITIHHVNELFDDGDIIFQAICEVTPEDTPATIAEKVHALEYQHFPKIIEQQVKLIK